MRVELIVMCVDCSRKKIDYIFRGIYLSTKVMQLNVMSFFRVSCSL